MGEINLKQHKVYRYELKYLISQGEYLYLKSLLSVILTPDKYSAELGDYFIRSVYFDTPYHRDYVEKKEKYFEKNIEMFPNSIRIYQNYPEWKLSDLKKNHSDVVTELLNVY